MTQQLRALAVLKENLGSVPNSHTVTHNQLSIQFQELYHPLLASEGTQAHTRYTDMYAGETSTT